MKKCSIAVLLSALLVVSCLSFGGRDVPSQYTLHNGATMEKGPMGFLLTASADRGTALRPIEPMAGQLVCRFTLKSALSEGTRNGFLVLGQQLDPAKTIMAGIYIGAREFVIEGPGVTEPINVQIPFDQSKEFAVTIIVNFKKGFVEMQTAEREIGTGLAPHMQQITHIGYMVNNTSTHFSRIEISNE